MFAYHLSPYPVVLIGRYTDNSVSAIVAGVLDFFRIGDVLGNVLTLVIWGVHFCVYFNGYNTTSMQVKQHSNTSPQNTSLYSKSLIYIICEVDLL